MPVRYFIPNVLTDKLLQWEGDNLNEVIEFVTYLVNVTVNEDNSLTLWRTGQQAVQCPVGWWIGGGPSTTPNTDGKQEVFAPDINMLTEPRQ